MDGQEIISAVASEGAIDGAKTVASEVTSIVATGDAVIESQIAAHSVQSEDRHEEILEGQEWLEEKLNQLVGLVSSQATQITTMQGILSTQLAELRSSIHQPTTPQVTPQVTPQTEPTPPVETPPSDVEENPVARTPSPERATAKRRLI